MLQIIYYSEAVPGLSFDAVREILHRSRERNARLEISGILFFDGVGFIQVLEGEEGVVSDLFARIEADDRHHRLRLLSRKPIERREFGNWAMAFAWPEGRAEEEMGGWIDYPPEDLATFSATGSSATRLLGMFVEGMLAAVTPAADGAAFSLTLAPSGRTGRTVCSTSPRDYLVEMGRLIAQGLPDSEVTVRVGDGGEIGFNRRGPMKKGEIELF